MTRIIEWGKYNFSTNKLIYIYINKYTCEKNTPTIKEYIQKKKNI